MKYVLALAAVLVFGACAHHRDVRPGVGGAAWVFGGRNESNAGGVLGLGGTVASGVMGQGYTTEMKFKCQ